MPSSTPLYFDISVHKRTFFVKELLFFNLPPSYLGALFRQTTVQKPFQPTSRQVVYAGNKTHGYGFRIVQFTNIIVSMCEAQQKQIKLVEVYRELSSLKQQLHQLMQPDSTERTGTTKGKLHVDKTQPSPKSRIELPKPQRVVYRIVKEDVVSHSPQILAEQGKLGIHSSIGNRDSELKNSRLEFNSPVNPMPDHLQMQSLRTEFWKDHHRSHGNLQFFPKPHKQIAKKNVFTNKFNPIERKEQKTVENKMKQFAHGRHNSQRELKFKHKKDQRSYHETCEEKEYISQEKLQMKQFFLLKKNLNLSNFRQDNGRKTLVRMNAEFDDPYRYDLQSITVKEEQENLQKIRILQQKIQNLQEINAQKESIIRVLEQELKDIECNFKQMERNIMGILKHRSTACNGGKVEETQLNEALKEMICDMQLQKSELKRLHTDCQRWRRMNMEQEQKISEYEAAILRMNKLNGNLINLKKENDMYREQVQVLANKLEVAVHENRLKDEFIVKFLMGRTSGNHQSEQMQWVVSTLEAYMRSCNYPNNNLLEKLNEQEAQIKKLKSLLDKTRKNSV